MQRHVVTWAGKVTVFCRDNPEMAILTRSVKYRHDFGGLAGFQ
jgi:hypothetical protein